MQISISLLDVSWAIERYFFSQHLLTRSCHTIRTKKIIITVQNRVVLLKKIIK